MIKNVYAVYDSCSGIYAGPFLFNQDGEAVRWFGDQAVSDNSIGNHPEHYTLYRVGRWDDGKGCFIPEDRICLHTAEEMVTLSRKLEVVQDA